MIQISGIGVKPRKPAYRKPDAVRELELLATDEARRKYSTMKPEHLAPRKFRDDTANNLTKCITTYLRLKGAFCSRLNNGGVFDYKLNRYRPGTNRKGLPDILATYQGNSLMIEVKAGRDRMSEHQKRIRGEQTESGGLWYTARNFSDFKKWFDNLEAFPRMLTGG